MLRHPAASPTRPEWALTRSTPAAATPRRSAALDAWLDGRPLDDATFGRLPRRVPTTRARAPGERRDGGTPPRSEQRRDHRVHRGPPRPRRLPSATRNAAAQPPLADERRYSARSA